MNSTLSFTTACQPPPFSLPRGRWWAYHIPHLKPPPFFSALRGGRMVKKVEQEMNFIKLLTYDLFSLNFPIADYMLLPSFTDPYDYHVGIRINLQCANPELHYNLAEFVMFDSYVLIMQGKARLEIKISIHKYGVRTLPAITKYLLKLIHVLCYEKPS